jgi:ankyrin repeat protein
VSAGADPHALNRWGCSAVHWAASTGDIALCEFLATLGLDFAQHNNQGHDGLMKAAWNGAAALCAHLLRQPGGEAALRVSGRSGSRKHHRFPMLKKKSLSKGVQYQLCFAHPLSAGPL